MRILAVSELDLSARDGGATHFRELLRYLSESNEVRILVPDFGKRIYEYKLDVDYVRTARSRYSHRDSRLFFVAKILFFLSYQFFLFFKMLRITKSERIDVIYNRQGMLSFSQFLVSKIAGVPLISEVNGILAQELELVGVPESLIDFYKRFEHIVLRGTTRVITVTEPIKEFLRTNYHLELPIDVVPNGANVDLFRPLDSESCKNELNLGHEFRYVCYVGYLVPWQGVDYLIKAAPLILKSVSKTRFLIVGDGAFRDELERLVEDMKLNDSFVFKGSVPYEDVPRYINASEVCVAPFIRARNEMTGLSPIKIYEYMACGKPVVASRVGGVGDFIVQKGAGIAVEPEDEEGLAEAIVSLLSDESMSSEMGTKGRDTVVKEFGWDKNADDVENILKSTIAALPKNI